LGRKLWSERIGRIAGWMLLTSFGFLFWARTAAADMQNLASVMLAVVWFFARERRPELINYLVFYLLCALGAEMKGLLAIVLPILVILPWIAREGRWKAYLQVSHVGAALVAAALYLVPFFLAAYRPLPPGYLAERGGYSGLELVYRENILRFIAPFDHVEPFYFYLYELPRVLLPWSLLFIVALAAAMVSLRRLGRSSRWLLETIALLFVFFSASGSKRWYYILPTAPFCALLMAVFMSEPGWQRSKRFCLQLIAVVSLAIAAVYLISPLVWPLALRCGFGAPDGLRYGTFALGVLVLAAWGLARKRPAVLVRGTGTDRDLAWLVVAVAVLLGGAFAVQQPSVDQLRTKKEFALRLRGLVTAPGDVIFFREAPTDVVFYLNLPGPVAALDAPQLRGALEGTSGTKIVVSQRESLADLGTLLPDIASAEPACAEAVMPWQRDDVAKKLVAFRVSAAGGHR